MHNYYLNKEQRAQRAKDWYSLMDKYFLDETVVCILGTKEYPADTDIDVAPLYNYMDIRVKQEDSVTAIFNQKNYKKMAVLNFASYKNPGGKFLNGSSAQEESLCHYSNLYNVLSEMKDNYYEPNKKRLNRALYNDNLLYTPGITFFSSNDKILTNKRQVCDVITCAAPNKTAAKRFQNVSNEAIIQACISRIDHVLQAAYHQRVDTLILGAFGCGVFGNEPNVIASIFFALLESKYERCFENVIFAIPMMSKFDNTFNEFNKILCRNIIVKGDKNEELKMTMNEYRWNYIQKNVKPIDYIEDSIEGKYVQHLKNYVAIFK